jgi:hypothetical protein
LPPYRGLLTPNGRLLCRQHQPHDSAAPRVVGVFVAEADKLAVVVSVPSTQIGGDIVPAARTFPQCFEHSPCVLCSRGFSSYHNMIVAMIVVHAIARMVIVPPPWGLRPIGTIATVAPSSVTAVG